ncbi:hypothetical protein XENOCAPTIV_008335 [Xenoophorus captivus]|uniref:Uncharacterized protein n=1 Tax=Xenoophorus captivus TaxID=1517983 RepID=A0ABV0QQN2_9TELE
MYRKTKQLEIVMCICFHPFVMKRLKSSGATFKSGISGMKSTCVNLRATSSVGINTASLKDTTRCSTTKQEASGHENQGAPNTSGTKLLRSTSQGGVVKISRSLMFPWSSNMSIIFK